MPVMHKACRLETEETLIMRNRLAVGSECLVVVEIADVVAEEGVAPAAERERRLELAAECERGSSARDRQEQWPRGLAA